MFRSATDHHQEVYVFLVKITELKCEYSYVAMWCWGRHKNFCFKLGGGATGKPKIFLWALAPATQM
jgi:phenylacetate-coenzyme A ligase PaaK-like adenylate-forming protein